MGKDDRLYGKFTLDFADSPKIAPLSDGAFRALVEMTLYSRRLLTDGFIAEGVAKKKWKSKILDELMSNDPSKPSLERGVGGFFIRDYAEHQDTKEEVEARRERNRVNGRAGGLAKAKQVASKSVGDSLSETSSQRVAVVETETTTSKEVVRPEVQRLCDLLADRITSNGSKRPIIGKTWLDSARLLLDADKRPIGEAIAVLEWCQAEPFWKANILSMPKFREKYDQLRLQREGKNAAPESVDTWAGVPRAGVS